MGDGFHTNVNEFGDVLETSAFPVDLGLNDPTLDGSEDDFIDEEDEDFPDEDEDFISSSPDEDIPQEGDIDGNK